MSMRDRDPNNSPIMLAVVAASATAPNSTAEELANLAGYRKGTVQSYMSPLIELGRIHHSGWRPIPGKATEYMREYSHGPLTGNPPPHPRGIVRKCEQRIYESAGTLPTIPHDFLLLALGGQLQQQGAAA